MSLEDAINIVISMVSGLDMSEHDTKKSMTYQGIYEDNQRLLQGFEDFKKQQLEFNKELLQKLQKRDEYIVIKLEKRNQNLLTTIGDMHDTQKLLSPAKQPNKKWWEFWK